MHLVGNNIKIDLQYSLKIPFQILDRVVVPYRIVLVPEIIKDMLKSKS